MLLTQIMDTNLCLYSEFELFILMIDDVGFSIILCFNRITLIS